MYGWLCVVSGMAVTGILETLRSWVRVPQLTETFFIGHQKSLFEVMYIYLKE